MNRVGRWLIAANAFILLFEILLLIEAGRTYRAANPGLVLLLLLLIGLCVWSAIAWIGIRRLQNWGRVSILIICGILTLLGILFGAAAVATFTNTPLGWKYSLERLLSTLLVLIPAVIGSSGFIFFMRKSVREQFEATGPQPSGAAASIENLLPLAAYRKDETGYWKRLPFISYLFLALRWRFLRLFSPSMIPTCSTLV